MLVTFTSSTSGQIVMFAPVARQLLDLIGKKSAARGVITTEQLPEALRRLRSAAKGAPSAETTNDARDHKEDDREPPVSLGQRAYPLIEILEWTLREDGYVLWEANSDF